MAPPTTAEGSAGSQEQARTDRHAVAGKLLETWLSHESLAKWIGSGVKPEDAEILGLRIGALYAGILKGMAVETKETPRERTAKEKGLLQDSA